MSEDQPNKEKMKLLLMNHGRDMINAAIDSGDQTAMEAHLADAVDVFTAAQNL